MCFCYYVWTKHTCQVNIVAMVTAPAVASCVWRHANHGARMTGTRMTVRSSPSSKRTPKRKTLSRQNGTHSCGFDTWQSCVESPFCSEMRLVAWNPKPKSICDVRTHIILSSKELQQCHHYEESWQLSLETIRCASYGFAWLWRYCNLWVSVVYLRGYGRPFIAKGLGWWAKA